MGRNFPFVNIVFCFHLRGCCLVVFSGLKRVRLLFVQRAGFTRVGHGICHVFSACAQFELGRFCQVRTRVVETLYYFKRITDSLLRGNALF